MNTNGSINTSKARLVVKGFTQKEGMNYFDTCALVARISTIRTLLALTLINKLHIHQMDVKTTFLCGDLNKDINTDQCKVFVLLGNGRKVRKLVKSIY